MVDQSRSAQPRHIFRGYKREKRFDFMQYRENCTGFDKGKLLNLEMKV